MPKIIGSGRNKLIIEDANKIINILTRKQIIRSPFYLKTSPFVYFGIFTKNGFQVYPHQFSDFGKISISMRKTVENQNVHVLLRSTKHSKHWLKIHADEGIKDHQVLRLSFSTTEVLIEMIQNDILYAIRNPNWLNLQKMLYKNHKSKEYLESKKDRFAKRIGTISDIENKDWQTPQEKKMLSYYKKKLKKRSK